MNYFFAALGELCAVLFAITATPAALIDRNPKLIRPDTKRVTVISHGFLHNRSADIYLRSQLKKHSALTGPIYTINLGHPFQSIENYTLKLRKLILDVKRQTPQTQQLEIYLIGHSMGGLICTNYAVNFAETDEVKILKVITIASPLQGTKMAYIGSPFCKCAKEMLPQSFFLQKLQTQARKMKRSLFFHIGCGTDLLVSKKRSFFEGQNDCVFPYQGHMTPLYSPKVVSCILETMESSS